MTTPVDKIPEFNPDRLLNEVMAVLKLKNDAALARHLGVGPPVISKIRHRRVPVTATILILLHEASGISIRDLRFLMGDIRPHTGASASVHVAQYGTPATV